MQDNAVIKITDALFDPSAEISAFEKRCNRTGSSGAIVTFLGKVRANTHQSDDAVTGLYLEHFPGMTEKSIMSFCEEAKNRWTIEGLYVVHRYGVMKPDEPIVLVCVASAHRRDAFEATDYLMDNLKTKALFWKKEICETGETWIEPRCEDYQDVQRWIGDGKDE